MNKSILSGRLTDNTELKTTANNKQFCAFTLAVPKRKKGEALFMPIVTWEAVAQSCAKYLKKGSRILVIGEINIRSYDDAEGIKRWVTEVIADSVEFLDTKPKDGDQDHDEPYGPPPDINDEP